MAHDVAARQHQTNAYLRPTRLVRRCTSQLFLIPYAGAGASMFRDWGSLLPSDVELLSVQLPGREDRFEEPFVPRFRELVSEATAAIDDAIRGPYAIFGHSMGALLGFEILLALQEAGRFGDLFIASGCAAPQERRRASVSADAAELSDPPPGEPSASVAYQEALRADLLVCADYAGAGREVLASPICIYTGLGDEGVSRRDAEAWTRFSSHGGTVVGFPGGHFFIDQDAPAVTQRLTLDLLRTGLTGGTS